MINSIFKGIAAFLLILMIHSAEAQGISTFHCDCFLASKISI